MNKNIGIVIGIIVLVVIAAGSYVAMGVKGNTDMKEKIMMEEKVIDEKAMMDKSNSDTMMKKDGSEIMSEDKAGMVDEKTDTMVKAGTYEAYSADKVARAETGDVVIFFHASWCPSCRSLSSNIEESAASIPSTLTILKANYDSEKELKKKYGVTSQHTLVQVDTNGIMIKKWSGGGTLQSIVSQLQ